jgi:hypothetical protein
MMRMNLATPQRRFYGARVIGAVAMVLALLATASSVSPVTASPAIGSGSNPPLVEANANTDQFANVELPGDLGQSGFQVYVPQTEHTIRGYMLDYWRANGADSVYGYPISEPFASADSRYSQAFEGGVFEFYPELVWTDAPSISLMPVSQTVLTDRLGDFRRDGRRDAGGGDRRSHVWRDVDPAGSSAQRAIANGEIYSDVTGQTVTGAFYGWYASHEGASYLGNPLSQPVAERGGVVQYFDGGALFRNEAGDVSVLPIVKENSRRLGIDTTRVKRDGLPDYDELFFWKADNPNPLGDPYTPGRKWIEVSISQQALYAYQGNSLISSTLVSTGIEPNHTEIGTFHVRYKLEKQDMAGTTGPNGEVVALGEGAAEAASGNQTPYVVKDVPNVMYINMDAEALHGAYWHNNFGNRMSHGCINLPLDFAAFLFGWAPLGTMVWVHE